MKYMVMECHPAFAVVLDEEGRFLKVANRHYEVGQTVTDVIEMQIPQAAPQKKKVNKWVYSLAAMAACLMLVVTSVFQQMPYASIYMAINPEVRIDVNRKDVVVGLTGMNADGENLIQGYHYKKKDLNLVMDELVDSAIDMGYLHEGGKVTLTLDTENDEWIVSHGDALAEQLNQHLSEKISVTIEITNQVPQTPPQHTVTIPVIPEDSSYGEEDYGGTDSKTDVLEPNSSPSVTDSPCEDGQTDYGLDEPPVNTDGQSDYEDSHRNDDGHSEYDTSSEDDGQSVYDAPDDDDGQSAYDMSDDNGQSNYGNISSDGQTDHTAPDAPAGDSNHGIGDADDGNSNYGSDDDQDSSSDYEDPDDDDDD